MNSEKVLKTVEQLLQKQLSQIEQRILILSWEGQSYKDIEENTGYVIGYLRDIGSGIWKELSEVLGKRVTKKNLPLVLEQLEQNKDLFLSNKSQIQSEEDNIIESLDSKDDLSFPSAPVSSNSRFYVNRYPCEKLARAEISQQGCLLRIKAPQKMGKSSLLNQVIAQGNSLGYQIAYIDFKYAEEAVFKSINSLLHWFSAVVSQQLNLAPNLDYYWDEDMGSKISCKIFFESYILKHINSPLILAINELDRLFEFPETARDFLPLLRSFHEQSRRSAIWQKLRLVLVYSTDIYIPFKINQSPFNVGLSIRLPRFNEEQITNLAHRYGLNWQTDKEAKQLRLLVGGHPYLVNIALYYLSQETLSLQQLLNEAPTPNGIYSQHLQSYLILLQKDSQLMSQMYRVIDSDKPVKLDTVVAYKLESMGLIILNSFVAVPSCELYRIYFSETLNTEENDPPEY